MEPVTLDYLVRLITNNRINAIHDLLSNCSGDALKAYVEVLLEHRMFDIVNDYCVVDVAILKKFIEHRCFNDIIRYYIDRIDHNKYADYCLRNISLFGIFTENMSEEQTTTLRNDIFEKFTNKYNRQYLESVIDYFGYIPVEIFGLHYEYCHIFLANFFEKYPEQLHKCIHKVITEDELLYYASICTQINDQSIAESMFQTNPRMLRHLMRSNKMVIGPSLILNVLGNNYVTIHDRKYIGQNIVHYKDIIDKLMSYNDLKHYLWSEHMEDLFDLGVSPCKYLSQLISNGFNGSLHKNYILLTFMQSDPEFEHKYPVALQKMFFTGNIDNLVLSLVPKKYYKFLQALSNKTIMEQFHHYAQEIFDRDDYLEYMKYTERQKRRYVGLYDIQFECSD